MTGPPRIRVACPASFSWNGENGQGSFWISEGCGTDTGYYLDVVLPGGEGAAAFDLPSRDVTIQAMFSLQTLEDPLRTQFGTLKVVAGNITVHSRKAMGVDADLDIELDSNAGERISVIGHLVESNCTTGQATSCTY